MKHAQDAIQWTQLYNQVPLIDVPRHFAGMRQSPFLLIYLREVLARCGPGDRSLETGIGSGYGAIWLSLRGVFAEGIDYAPGIVERAVQVNNILSGSAKFRVGDLFDLDKGEAARYSVIHHQGVLEHFTVPQIRSALAQQVALADFVIFSVPSVYYPFEPEFGDERLLPLAEWERILGLFSIDELRYYGDPALGEREHVLAVLRGETITPKLRETMVQHKTPLPNGVSAIVHTRNESRHIRDCLSTVKEWADEIVVCDMESTDDTVQIAREFTDDIISHPLIQNFDRARNVSAMRARFRWILFLDADERVPPGLGPKLKELIATQGDTFDALLLPFRHYFAGRWMQCLYPGYTAPRLLRSGHFTFNPRLHSGARVDGKITLFPADDPELALEHHSFETMAQYLEKLNRYTDGEAKNMLGDGQRFHWQNAVRHFVHDFQAYYEQGQATKDGVHGFIYSFHSAFYRFEQHAKLFEQRYHAGRIEPMEAQIPASLSEMLRFALTVAEEKPLPQAVEIRVNGSDPCAAEIVWCGPLFDPSGYGEESRNFLFALEGAGSSVAAQNLPWSQDRVDLGQPDQERIETLLTRSVKPGFTRIVQNFPTAFGPHSEAQVSIGRTMFETDRLPKEWVDGCNRMDFVWVPSEFNRRTFTQSGVASEKLVVIPGCLDPAMYRTKGNHSSAIAGLFGDKCFTFLSVFDWTLHKGWDVLIRGFLEAFEGRKDIHLVLKVWSTMGYSAEQIREQARRFALENLGHEIRTDERIRFIDERLSRTDLVSLYQLTDAFVLPSRGEGWGRPYMEAMVCGKPTIGTNWSGNTAFMNKENSLLVDCDTVPVPKAGWEEIPTYRGHQWAEPNLDQFKSALRFVVEDPKEAAKTAECGREYVSIAFTRERVGSLMQEELKRAAELRTPHPICILQNDPIAVRWEGAQFVWHSLAHVNRELCLGLLASGGVDLSLVPTEPNHFLPQSIPRFQPLVPLAFQQLPNRADIHVRHFFPPRFESPDEGALVLIQPWEYGFLPIKWIEPIRSNVAEVWCYSKYVRDVYLASGVAEEMLKLMPLGVDTDVFQPDALPYIFTKEPGANRLKAHERPFVFLFVGGTLQRKGIDILLDAYLKAFSAYDNVLLVVKDTGTRTVYYRQTEHERILSLVADNTRPPIIYFDDDLTPHQLAGLYTACDCLVQPYRGEGFCLPALEAMACGVPVIATAGGPTDDFVDEEVGWRVDAIRRPFGPSKIGDLDCVGPTWMFEVDPEVLGRLMRAVYQDRTEVARLGTAAAKRVRNAWTWKHSTEVVLARMRAIKSAVSEGSCHEKARAGNNGTSSQAAQSKETRGSKSSKRKESQPILVRRRQPTISLCMIVKNEERVFHDCLESIRPWVDEIVVVDTGSTDSTAAIGERAGANVIHFPWCDSFAAARNQSLDHASGDWIFWMDADDTIPPDCGSRLREIAYLAEERVMGYLMKVHMPAAPGQEGFTIVDHVKLFRNLPSLRFEGRIHEQILDAINRADGLIEQTNLYVIHSGYDHSLEGQKRKRERDLYLLELDRQDRPEHPFVWFNFGMTYFHLKEYEKAVEALETALRFSKPQESTVRKLYAMLCGSYLGLGNLDSARSSIDRGLELFPRDPELLFRAANLYRDLGDLYAAERTYLKLLNDREVGHIDSLDVTMTGFKAHHNLGLVYLDLGKTDEAARQFTTALSLQPDFGPSLMGLGESYIRQGRFQEALQVADRLSLTDAEAGASLRRRCAESAYRR